MTDKYPRYSAGQPVTFSASRENAISQLLRDASLPKGMSLEPGTVTRFGNIVRCINNTGQDIKPHYGVFIDEPAYKPTSETSVEIGDPLTEFLVDTRFVLNEINGVAPRFGVALSHIPDGKVGEVLVDGIVPVRVTDITDEGDLVELRATGAAYAPLSQEPNPEGGAAKVLWSEDGSDEHWALVHVSQSFGSGRDSYYGTILSSGPSGLVFQELVWSSASQGFVLDGSKGFTAGGGVAADPPSFVYADISDQNLMVGKEGIITLSDWSSVDTETSPIWQFTSVGTDSFDFVGDTWLSFTVDSANNIVQGNHIGPGPQITSLRIQQDGVDVAQEGRDLVGHVTPAGDVIADIDTGVRTVQAGNGITVTGDPDNPVVSANVVDVVGGDVIDVNENPPASGIHEVDHGDPDLTPINSVSAMLTGGGKADMVEVEKNHFVIANEFLPNFVADFSEFVSEITGGTINAASGEVKVNFKTRTLDVNTDQVSGVNIITIGPEVDESITFDGEECPTSP